MNIKLSNNKIRIGACEAKVKHDDIAAIRINIDCEKTSVAAFGDGVYPSIMLHSGSDFTKLTFSEFKDFKVWSANIDDDVLDVCLVKESKSKKEDFVLGDKVWVDPPGGWRYGFPKVYDKEENPNLNDWLEKEGYPTNEINRLGDSFNCRFWNA